MIFDYTPQGVCSMQIHIDIDDDTKTINEIQFLGGCNGNLQGISALAKGRQIDEVADVLEGIQCGYKGTSCPDQLAKALKEAKEELS